MTMFAPCRASSRTMALPMPLLPPVTMATLSLRFILFLLFRARWKKKLGHQGGPTGLMRCANAATVVAVKIFVKQNVILELRIAREFRMTFQNGPLAVAAFQK